MSALSAFADLSGDEDWDDVDIQASKPIGGPVLSLPFSTPVAAATAASSLPGNGLLNVHEIDDVWEAEEAADAAALAELKTAVQGPASSVQARAAGSSNAVPDNFNIDSSPETVRGPPARPGASPLGGLQDRSRHSRSSSGSTEWDDSSLSGKSAEVPAGLAALRAGHASLVGASPPRSRARSGSSSDSSSEEDWDMSLALEDIDANATMATQAAGGSSQLASLRNVMSSMQARSSSNQAPQTPPLSGAAGDDADSISSDTSAGGWVRSAPSAAAAQLHRLHIAALPHAAACSPTAGKVEGEELPAPAQGQAYLRKLTGLLFNNSMEACADDLTRVSLLASKAKESQATQGLQDASPQLVLPWSTSTPVQPGVSQLPGVLAALADMCDMRTRVSALSVLGQASIPSVHIATEIAGMGTLHSVAHTAARSVYLAWNAATLAHVPSALPDSAAELWRSSADASVLLQPDTGSDSASTGICTPFPTIDSLHACVMRTAHLLLGKPCIQFGMQDHLTRVCDEANRALNACVPALQVASQDIDAVVQDMTKSRDDTAVAADMCLRACSELAQVASQVRQNMAQHMAGRAMYTEWYNQQALRVAMLVLSQLQLVKQTRGLLRCLAFHAGAESVGLLRALQSRCLAALRAAAVLPTAFIQCKAEAERAHALYTAWQQAQDYARTTPGTSTAQSGSRRKPGTEPGRSNTVRHAARPPVLSAPVASQQSSRAPPPLPTSMSLASTDGISGVETQASQHAAFISWLASGCSSRTAPAADKQGGSSPLAHRSTHSWGGEQESGPPLHFRSASHTDNAGFPQAPALCVRALEVPAGTLIHMAVLGCVLDELHSTRVALYRHDSAAADSAGAALVLHCVHTLRLQWVQQARANCACPEWGEAHAADMAAWLPARGAPHMSKVLAETVRVLSGSPVVSNGNAATAQALCAARLFAALRGGIPMSSAAPPVAGHATCWPLVDELLDARFWHSLQKGGQAPGSQQPSSAKLPECDTLPSAWHDTLPAWKQLLRDSAPVAATGFTTPPTALGGSSPPKQPGKPGERLRSAEELAVEEWLRLAGPAWLHVLAPASREQVWAAASRHTPVAGMLRLPGCTMASGAVLLCSQWMCSDLASALLCYTHLVQSVTRAMFYLGECAGVPSHAVSAIISEQVQAVGTLAGLAGSADNTPRRLSDIAAAAASSGVPDVPMPSRVRSTRQLASIARVVTHGSIGHVQSGAKARHRRHVTSLAAPAAASSPDFELAVRALRRVVRQAEPIFTVLFPVTARMDKPLAAAPSSVREKLRWLDYQVCAWVAHVLLAAGPGMGSAALASKLLQRLHMEQFVESVDESTASAAATVQALAADAWACLQAAQCAQLALPHDCLITTGIPVLERAASMAAAANATAQLAGRAACWRHMQWRCSMAQLKWACYLIGCGIASSDKRVHGWHPAELLQRLVHSAAASAAAWSEAGQPHQGFYLLWQTAAVATCIATPSASTSSAGHGMHAVWLPARSTVQAAVQSCTHLLLGAAVPHARARDPAADSDAHAMLHFTTEPSSSVANSEIAMLPAALVPGLSACMTALASAAVAMHYYTLGLSQPEPTAGQPWPAKVLLHWQKVCGCYVSSLGQPPPARSTAPRRLDDIVMRLSALSAVAVQSSMFAPGAMGIGAHAEHAAPSASVARKRAELGMSNVHISPRDPELYHAAWQGLTELDLLKLTSSAVAAVKATGMADVAAQLALWCAPSAWRKVSWENVWLLPLMAARVPCAPSAVHGVASARAASPAAANLTQGSMASRSTTPRARAVPSTSVSLPSAPSLHSMRHAAGLVHCTLQQLLQAAECLLAAGSPVEALHLLRSVLPGAPLLANCSPKLSQPALCVTLQPCAWPAAARGDQGTPLLQAQVLLQSAEAASGRAHWQGLQLQAQGVRASTLWVKCLSDAGHHRSALASAAYLLHLASAAEESRRQPCVDSMRHVAQLFMARAKALHGALRHPHAVFDDGAAHSGSGGAVSGPATSGQRKFVELVGLLPAAHQHAHSAWRHQHTYVVAGRSGAMQLHRAHRAGVAAPGKSASIPSSPLFVGDVHGGPADLLLALDASAVAAAAQFAAAGDALACSQCQLLAAEGVTTYVLGCGMGLPAHSCDVGRAEGTGVGGSALGWSNPGTRRKCKQARIAALYQDVHLAYATTEGATAAQLAALQSLWPAAGMALSVDKALASVRQATAALQQGSLITRLRCLVTYAELLAHKRTVARADPGLGPHGTPWHGPPQPAATGFGRAEAAWLSARDLAFWATSTVLGDPAVNAGNVRRGVVLLAQFQRLVRLLGMLPAPLLQANEAVIAAAMRMEAQVAAARSLRWKPAIQQESLQDVGPVTVPSALSDEAAVFRLQFLRPSTATPTAARSTAGSAAGKTVPGAGGRSRAGSMLQWAGVWLPDVAAVPELPAKRGVAAGLAASTSAAITAVHMWIGTLAGIVSKFSGAGTLLSQHGSAVPRVMSVTPEGLTGRSPAYVPAAQAAVHFCLRNDACPTWSRGLDLGSMMTSWIRRNVAAGSVTALAEHMSPGTSSAASSALVDSAPVTEAGLAGEGNSPSETALDIQPSRSCASAAGTGSVLGELQRFKSTHQATLAARDMDSTRAKLRSTARARRAKYSTFPPRMHKPLDMGPARRNSPAKTLRGVAFQQQRGMDTWLDAGASVTSDGAASASGSVHSNALTLLRANSIASATGEHSPTLGAAYAAIVQHLQAASQLGSPSGGTPHRKTSLSSRCSVSSTKRAPAMPHPQGSTPRLSKRALNAQPSLLAGVMIRAGSEQHSCALLMHAQAMLLACAGRSAAVQCRHAAATAAAAAAAGAAPGTGPPSTPGAASANSLGSHGMSPAGLVTPGAPTPAPRVAPPARTVYCFVGSLVNWAAVILPALPAPLCAAAVPCHSLSALHEELSLTVLQSTTATDSQSSDGLPADAAAKMSRQRSTSRPVKSSSTVGLPPSQAARAVQLAPSPGTAGLHSAGYYALACQTAGLPAAAHFAKWPADQACPLYTSQGALQLYMKSSTAQRAAGQDPLPKRDGKLDEYAPALQRQLQAIVTHVFPHLPAVLRALAGFLENAGQRVGSVPLSRPSQPMSALRRMKRLFGVKEQVQHQPPAPAFSLHVSPGADTFPWEALLNMVVNPLTSAADRAAPASSGNGARGSSRATAHIAAAAAAPGDAAEAEPAPGTAAALVRARKAAEGQELRIAKDYGKLTFVRWATAPIPASPFWPGQAVPTTATVVIPDSVKSSATDSSAVAAFTRHLQLTCVSARQLPVWAPTAAPGALAAAMGDIAIPRVLGKPAVPAGAVLQTLQARPDVMGVHGVAPNTCWAVDAPSWAPVPTSSSDIADATSCATLPFQHNPAFNALPKRTSSLRFRVLSMPEILSKLQPSRSDSTCNVMLVSAADCALSAARLRLAFAAGLHFVVVMPGNASVLAALTTRLCDELRTVLVGRADVSAVQALDTAVLAVQWHARVHLHVLASSSVVSWT